MDEYIIPANTKKGQLILNVFRPLDLGIILSGAGLSLVLLLVITASSITATVIKLLPVAICAFLVMPVPYYHNVLVFIQEMYLYLTRPSRYLWRGWCATRVYRDEIKK